MIPWQVHEDPRSTSTGMPDRGMNVFLLAPTAARVVLGLAEQDLNRLCGPAPVSPGQLNAGSGGRRPLG
jgi:hypothetical protein